MHRTDEEVYCNLIKLVEVICVQTVKDLMGDKFSLTFENILATKVMPRQLIQNIQLYTGARRRCSLFDLSAFELIDFDYLVTIPNGRLPTHCTLQQCLTHHTTPLTSHLLRLSPTCYNTSVYLIVFMGIVVLMTVRLP